MGTDSPGGICKSNDLTDSCDWQPGGPRSPCPALLKACARGRGSKHTGCAGLSLHTLTRWQGSSLLWGPVLGHRLHIVSSEGKVGWEPLPWSQCYVLPQDSPSLGATGQGFPASIVHCPDRGHPHQKACPSGPGVFICTHFCRCK